MNRSVYYLLGILVILVAVIFFLPKKKTSKVSKDSLKTQFTVQDTANVGRIFLADRYGRQILLERKGNSWEYTNKATQKNASANPTAVQALLKTLNRIRLRSTVPKSSEEAVVKEMAGQSIKVEVYDRKNKRIRAFYLGKGSVNETGNYSMLEDDSDDNLYIVYEPGFSGELNPKFSVEERTWQDEAIFRLNPENIQTLKVKYHEPQHKVYSFEINKKGQAFQVNVLDAKTQDMDRELLNELSVKDYLDNYALVGAESIISDDPMRDSILINSPQFATISIELKNGQKNEVLFMPANYRAGLKPDGSPTVRGKMLRYVGLLNKGEEVFMLQHRVVAKLFLAYQYFYGQEVPGQSAQ